MKPSLQDYEPDP